MKTTLRNYQQQILEDLIDVPSVALFLPTGTGKTVTSLKWFEENGTNKLLIVCPKSILSQWAGVIKAELPHLNVLVFPKNASIAKKDNIVSMSDADVIIVNFDIVSKMKSLYKKVNANWSVIVDESHRMKNPDAKVTQELLRIGNKTIHKAILTATPTQGLHGGYIDYWSQLKFIGAINMDLDAYKARYCIVVPINFGGRYPVKTITGYKRTYELDRILQQYARSYAPKYGEYEPEHIEVKLEKPDSYNKMLREEAYKDIALTSSMAKRIAAKTLCTGVVAGMDIWKDHHNYVDNNIKLDWLKEFIEDTDEKLMIFYNYDVEKDALVMLLKELGKKYVIINGQTKDKFAEIKKDFDVVIGQYQAMAESLDGLQYKTHIQILFALPESSLLYKQAIGRIDRIGQTKVPTYYYPIIEGTIEEKIYDMIQKKLDFSQEVLERLLVGV